MLQDLGLQFRMIGVGGHFPDEALPGTWMPGQQFIELDSDARWSRFSGRLPAWSAFRHD